MKLYHIACYDKFRELKCACHVVADSKDDAVIAGKAQCDNPTGLKNLDLSAYEIPAASDKNGTLCHVYVLMQEEE